MVFFQTLLFAGYAYAHLSQTLLGARTQAIVHIALLAVAACLLPIAPDASWKPDVPAAPTWHILSLLGVSVGLPYFVLSATGPLVQAWFCRISGPLAVPVVRRVELRLARGLDGVSVLCRAAPGGRPPGLVLGPGLCGFCGFVRSALPGGTGRPVERGRRAIGNRQRARGGPRAEPGQALRLAGFARAGLADAAGHDKPCLSGCGRDAAVVGGAAGPVPAVVHHLLRSPALVPPRLVRTGGVGAAIGRGRRRSTDHDRLRGGVQFRAGNRPAVGRAVRLLHALPWRVGSAASRSCAT